MSSMDSLSSPFLDPDRTRRSDLENRQRDENRFFKHKELDFLLILCTPKTGVGPHEHESVARTLQSNPLAFFFLNFFYKNNLTQFYST